MNKVLRYQCTSDAGFCKGKLQESAEKIVSVGEYAVDHEGSGSDHAVIGAELCALDIHHVPASMERPLPHRRLDPLSEMPPSLGYGTSYEDCIRIKHIHGGSKGDSDA